jgi:hypothetical protein
VIRGVRLDLLESFQRVGPCVPGAFEFQVTLLRTAVLLPPTDVSGGRCEGDGAAGSNLPKRHDSSEPREEARRRSTSGKRESKDAAASRRTTTGGTSNAEVPPPSPADAADAAGTARGRHENGHEGGGGGSGESAEPADETEPEFLPLAEVTFLQVRERVESAHIHRVWRGVYGKLGRAGVWPARAMTVTKQFCY